MSRLQLTKLCREELGLILSYSFYLGNLNEVRMILLEIESRNFLEGLEEYA